MPIRINRAVTLPDPIRLERFRRAPELGPKVLFFTGGTALRPLSQRLIDYTHNSIHLVTPFDSGGSSAKLREAFHMPAVGDVRSRLMSLADRSVKGAPAIYALFAHRFPKDHSPEGLLKQLEEMLRGRHPLVADVPDPMRKIIRTHLRFFAQRMPPDFDLRGASVGNLILTGGYFNYDRHLDPVIFLFSRLVEARGKVRPVLNQDLHLVAKLQDGSTIVGQHLLTGKEAPPITSPVTDVFVSQSRTDPKPFEAIARRKVRDLITSADLICYPMGSFYSSLIANFLPHGIGQAVSEAGVPKVYIPNQGADPEMVGLTMMKQVRAIFHYLERSAATPPPRESLLNFILVDLTRGNYGSRSDFDALRRHGIQVLDTRLINDASAPYLDEQLVIESLLSLV